MRTAFNSTCLALLFGLGLLGACGGKLTSGGTRTGGDSGTPGTGPTGSDQPSPPGGGPPSATGSTLPPPTSTGSGPGEPPDAAPPIATTCPSAPIVGPSAPGLLATLPSSVAFLAVDCNSLYVAPYEVGVVTAVSLANGATTVLNTVAATTVAIDATRVYSVSPGGGGEPQGLVTACPKTGCGGGYTTIASGQTNVWGVAVDSENVYWTSQGPPAAVSKAPVGGGAPTVLVGPGSASWITVSGGQVLYSGFGNGNGAALLMSVPVVGGTATTLFTPNPNNSVGAIASDGTNAYFVTTDGIVGKVPLAGGAAVTLAATGSFIDSVAVDTTDVYWTSQYGIARVPVGGGAVSTIATAQSNPSGLVVDANNVYWSNMGDNTIMWMKK